MKLIAGLVWVVILASPVYSQSGRRVKEVIAVPTPSQEAVAPQSPAASHDEQSTVTAEKNQDYRCTTDGSLERILEPENASERVFSVSELDSRVKLTSKPQPSYTKEARRLGIQGFVTLRVLLSPGEKPTRVRVVKGLRAGLTENAIRAACKIEFKPATKAGQPVAQWLTVEYVFRLSDSSIFTP